jgi:hypothetical protein
MVAPYLMSPVAYFESHPVTFDFLVFLCHSQNIPGLFRSPEAHRAVRSHNTLLTTLTAYEELWHSTWCDLFEIVLVNSVCCLLFSNMFLLRDLGSKLLLGAKDACINLCLPFLN